MRTITVYKRGYDFDHGTDWVLIPYAVSKDVMIRYIKLIFGQDCFEKFRFVLGRKH